MPYLFQEAIDVSQSDQFQVIRLSLKNFQSRRALIDEKRLLTFFKSKNGILLLYSQYQPSFRMCSTLEYLQIKLTVKYILYIATRFRIEEHKMLFCFGVSYVLCSTRIGQ